MATHPEEPHDLKETNRRLREALQDCHAYWSERESCSGARSKTTIRRSAINPDCEREGGRTGSQRSKKKGGPATQAGPPFNAKRLPPFKRFAPTPA